MYKTDCLVYNSDFLIYAQAGVFILHDSFLPMTGNQHFCFTSSVTDAVVQHSSLYHSPDLIPLSGLYFKWHLNWNHLKICHVNTSQYSVF